MNLSDGFVIMPLLPEIGGLTNIFTKWMLLYRKKWPYG